MLVHKWSWFCSQNINQLHFKKMCHYNQVIPSCMGEDYMQERSYTNILSSKLYSSPALFPATHSPPCERTTKWPYHNLIIMVISKTSILYLYMYDNLLLFYALFPVFFQMCNQVWHFVFVIVFCKQMSDKIICYKPNFDRNAKKYFCSKFHLLLKPQSLFCTY